MQVRSVGAVVLGVEEANEGPKSLLVWLQGQSGSAESADSGKGSTNERVFDIGVDVDSRQPLVAKVRSTVKVDRGDDLHVGC